MIIDRTHTSPNHSSRAGQAIDLLLLHATVGPLGASIAWLCNPASEVSSHYVIAKTGAIYQLVDESQAAWHAGVAVWRGQTKINELSIGVELENDNTGRDPYPPAQMQALLALTCDIQTRHPAISFARHLDVARPVGRKTDPAGFPWERYLAMVTTPPPPALHTVIVGAFGAIARTDYRAPAPSVAYFQPGTAIEIDGFFQNGYRHVANGIGFVADGDLVVQA